MFWQTKSIIYSGGGPPFGDMLQQAVLTGREVQRNVETPN